MFLSKKIVFFYFYINEKMSDLTFLSKKIVFLLLNKKMSDLTFLSKKNCFFTF
jgi:hypothetical protein